MSCQLKGINGLGLKEKKFMLQLLYDDASFHCLMNSTMIRVGPYNRKDFGEFM
jgi:hypothetical protein